MRSPGGGWCRGREASDGAELKNFAKFTRLWSREWSHKQNRWYMVWQLLGRQSAPVCIKKTAERGARKSHHPTFMLTRLYPWCIMVNKSPLIFTLSSSFFFAPRRRDDKNSTATLRCQGEFEPRRRNFSKAPSWGLLLYFSSLHHNFEFYDEEFFSVVC